jgi:hypothetical protein
MVKLAQSSVDIVTFFNKMGIRPVFAYKLADLKSLELSDQPGTDDEADDERCNRSIDRPEGDITKDVKR